MPIELDGWQKQAGRQGPEHAGSRRFRGELRAEGRTRLLGRKLNDRNAHRLLLSCTSLDPHSLDMGRVKTHQVRSLLRDPFNCAFASGLDRAMERYQPALWIHGHMHDPVDGQLGKTRLVANPAGLHV